MNKYFYLKKTLLSKQSAIIWLLIIVETIFLFIARENLKVDNLYIYLNSDYLFSYGVIIIEYLLFISIYMNYFRSNYVIIRCKSISKLERVVIKNIIILTLIFVIAFNIVLLLVIKFNYQYIYSYEDLRYILFTILMQFLSFLILGFIHSALFFKNYNIKKSLISTFVIYMISIISINKIVLYFVLPIKMSQIEIFNMIKNILSIHIIFLIYFINRKNKGIDLYEKQI